MNPVTVNNSAASLYVDDLHPEVTEAMLFEKFCKVGPIHSIRVCRDTVTRRSLGYGYVNFHQAADAERAVDTLDLDAIKGKPMHISFQKDPSLRRSGLGKVFVKNLDKAIDNKAIYDSFSAFGTIMACKVATDENGESCGYGFVRFETEESAQSAIEKVNNMQLNGRNVIVEKFVPRKERNSGAGDQALNFTNVYIKNFPVEWSEEDFYRVCQAYGKILSLKIMTDTEGSSKGFGFVSFENHQAAQQCVDALNGKELMGRQIFAGRAQTKSERSTAVTTRPETGKTFPGVNLYIKNLDDEIDDDRLKKEFARFGSITSAKVMRHDSGVSRGFGFVCFTTQEAANNAVMQMNNQVISTKPLYVALHQSKEVRQAQLASQRMNMGYLPGQVYQGPAFSTYYQTIPQPGAVPSQVVIQPQTTITQQGTIQPQTAIQPQRVRPRQGTIQTQGTLPTHRGAIPAQGGLLSQSAIPTQVSLGPQGTLQGTLQGTHGQHRTLPSGHMVHQAHAALPGHVSHPTHATYPTHVTHPTHIAHPAHTSIQTTLPVTHRQGGLPPQGNMYPIQFAAQVHHPRWPTTQIHPASQPGYHIIPGLAAHQYGTMNHIAATVPRSIPVPGGPPPTHVAGKDESQRPLI